MGGNIFTQDRVSNCHVGQADIVNIFDKKFINNPNEIDMTVLVNYHWWFFMGGVFVIIVYFVLSVFTAKVIGATLKNDIFSGTSAMIVLYTTSAALTYVTLEGIERLLYKMRLFHIKYKNKAITYNGRERKFYSEIWDIKIHGISNKKISIYGVKSEPNSKPYVINMRFRNEAEAKYLHDIFHAGKYMTTNK